MSVRVIHNGGNNAFSSVQNETGKQKESLISVFSTEILAQIFSHTDLPTLGALRQVSQYLGKVINISSVEKNVIFKTVSFGNRQWANLGGNELIANENPAEELNDLQENFGENFKKLFPGKKMNDCLLVRILKTHTAKNLGELLLKCGLEATPYLRVESESIIKSYWIVIPKKENDFCTRKQWKIEAEPTLEIPTAVDALAAMVAQLSPKLATFKQQEAKYEEIRVQMFDMPTFQVGGFSQAGRCSEIWIDASALFDKSVGDVWIRRF
jgi:hypothetical protein